MTTITPPRALGRRHPAVRLALAVALSSIVASVAIPAATGELAIAAQGPGVVKVTPLGSHAGEFCRNDRAMLFEDPTGVRILYDPGRTVDEGDPRLGEVHVMLLSHGHTDHIGDTRPNRSAPGTCAAPASGGTNTDSNFVTIAGTKGAAVFSPGELDAFISRKIQTYRGSATAACTAAGLENETIVPVGVPCTGALRPGGSRTVRRAGAGGAVRIAVVPAFHSNGIPAGLIESPGLPAGLAGYGGSEAGYVIQFTNGLTAYLTGDTGFFGDMETIIARYYRPNLVVANVGDVNSMGPNEAAYALQYLVRPRSVIPSHTNEQGTQGGAVRPGTKVERFRDRVASFVDVVLPLSGVTRSFDGEGRCVGCE